MPLDRHKKRSKTDKQTDRQTKQTETKLKSSFVGRNESTDS
jgi:hypothetical protein